MKGFQDAEKEYIDRAQDPLRYQADFSGSCAIVCFIISKQPIIEALIATVSVS